MSHSQSNVSADLLVPVGQIHLPSIHVPTVWGVHGAESEQSGSGTVESQNYIEKNDTSNSEKSLSISRTHILHIIILVSKPKVTANSSLLFYNELETDKI